MCVYIYIQYIYEYDHNPKNMTKSWIQIFHAQLRSKEAPPSARLPKLHSNATKYHTLRDQLT